MSVWSDGSEWFKVRICFCGRRGLGRRRWGWVGSGGGEHWRWGLRGGEGIGGLLGLLDFGPWILSGWVEGISVFGDDVGWISGSLELMDLGGEWDIT